MKRAVKIMPQERFEQVPEGNTQNPTLLLTECSDCGGNGFKLQNSRAIYCECAIERLIAAALPKRYRNANLNDFSEEARTFVGTWLEKPTDGPLISGTTGAGKTHLGAAVFRDRAEKRIRVAFRRSSDLFLSMRETYRNNCSEQSVLEPLERAQILVLDDLGAGSLSDHERRVTLELIDRRMNAVRPTIITTNWDLDQLAQRLDERIASRLSAFTGMELRHEDRRIRRTN